MTREDYLATMEALEKTRKEVTQSPEKALAYLVKLGICNPDGTLTKEYRGKD